MRVVKANIEEERSVVLLRFFKELACQQFHVSDISPNLKQEMVLFCVRKFKWIHLKIKNEKL